MTARWGNAAHKGQTELPKPCLRLANHSSPCTHPRGSPHSANFEPFSSLGSALVLRPPAFPDLLPGPSEHRGVLGSQVK